MGSCYLFLLIIYIFELLLLSFIISVVEASSTVGMMGRSKVIIAQEH